MGGLLENQCIIIKYKIFHALSTHLKSPKLKLNMFRPSGPHQLTPYCYAQMECAVEQLSDKVTSKRGENVTQLLHVVHERNSIHFYCSLHFSFLLCLFSLLLRFVVTLHRS